MIIRIMGKQSFVSKAGKPCNILHTVYKNDYVEGFACDRLFVSDEVYNKALLNGSYEVVYGASSTGRAFVSDLVVLKNES